MILNAEHLMVQIKQADARGDEALRRAHAAEAELESLRAKVKELTLQALSDSGQAIEAMERERVLREMLMVTALRAYPDKSKDEFREYIDSRLAASRSDGGAG